VSISNATTSSYTTPAQSLADNGAVFAVVVSNATGSTTSSSAALAVTAATIPAATGTDVVTSRNDQARTGQNLTESTLTVANVNTATFGLLRTLPVDGKVDAQPFIADGKVFLGTTTSVGVFGLLH
jgi:DNA uptake protein ComE-like DNA-binding protein